jgi:hypothetical protein
MHEGWQSLVLTRTKNSTRAASFVDWSDLMQLSGRAGVTWVTLPLEAPEGLLGAATVAVRVHAPRRGLMQRLHAAALLLAQALTHTKCKHDYSVRGIAGFSGAHLLC